jgi:hypothetical protein
MGWSYPKYGCEKTRGFGGEAERIKPLPGSIKFFKFIDYLRNW